ncbi:MAG TPA: HAD-IA family hydrolase [Dermatophilaceae bacterium]|nr:HAD-IA family hydrolase [Dermatophilaceae bacterium]
MSLVVFDCDGVLVDSERLAVEIDVRAITELGWPITAAEVIERHVGISEADAIADIEAHLGRPVPGGWAESWAEAYLTAFAQSLEPVPGVTAAVQSLVERGYAVCVASSGSLAKIERSLRKTGLWPRFAGRSFSAAQVRRGKPAPDLFLHAALAMGMDPSACVVVEDSRHGVAAARAAGMAVVGYAGGITPAAQLADADQVITDMADLLAAVARPAEGG